MKLIKNIKIRAVGGYLAIFLAQTSLSIAAPGDITTVAGDNSNGGQIYGIDATISPAGSCRWIAVDPEGNFYISDSGRRIGYVDKETGILSHFAGTAASGNNGDGEPAADASFGLTAGVALDSDGNLFIVDSFYHTIRRVDAETGLISTVAGIGTQGFSGDSGPATEAELSQPSYLTVDHDGNIYFSDTGGMRIRRIDGATQIITTITGSGTGGFSGNNEPAVDAEVNLVRGMTTDPDGNLYFADSSNHRIRKIDMSTGIISAYAGRGGGAVTENVHALTAGFSYPFDVCFDGTGNMFISDHSHYCVRRVDGETKMITTIAGTTVLGYSGDGGPADEAMNKGIFSLATDQTGNLYLADYANYLVRMVEKAGTAKIKPPAKVEPAGNPVDRAILLRKVKKLKKKLTKAKKADRNSTVRKLKKQIKKLKSQL